MRLRGPAVVAERLALSLAVAPEDYGNIDAYLEKAAGVLAQNNALGRFSTWSVPVNMSMIYGGFEYAKNYLDGAFAEKTDAAALKRI